MSSEQIRKSFLEFFEKKGHKIVSSSSLIPDDPSVLLTTAGMQQFKRYYTNELNALEDFGSQRTVSAQKCFRTSDIEEVGDKTHLTFFEMLGNFSFGPVDSDNPEDLGAGGYFKRATVLWAYEFITQVLGISADRIKVSVFKGDLEIPFDEESYKIWREEIGISKDKIILGERDDNFWGPTGDEGPCGPCTEIYVDEVEIWNLVFNEYYKNKDGRFVKTKNFGVDTGMGLERLVSVIEGVDDVFKTDIFQPLVSKLGELAPAVDERIVKILADHLRAGAFLIADGVRPSNKEAGYVLRRLLRRILAYQIKYDIHADLFPQTIKIIKEKFGGVYSGVNETKKILEVMENESQKFQEAVGKGIKELEKIFDYYLKTRGKSPIILRDYIPGQKLEIDNPLISGKEAFELYSTYGLPVELIEELVREKNFVLDKKGFEEEIKRHQEISRVGQEKKFGGHGLVLSTGELKAVNDEEMKKVVRLHTATHLLQWALREVLGKDVKQMGSDITAERTRFDFSFDRKLTSEEIKKMEELINEKIKQNLRVYFKEMSKTEAEKTGAISFFKAKYPDIVKVYFIDPSTGSGQAPISAEFCGGPHVEKTSEIGKFRILKEEAVAAGIRRIRGTVN